MLNYLIAPPVYNLVESFVDGFRDAVKPVTGSVLYCDLVFGYAEHTGIYLGAGRIAHLNGQGIIEAVDRETFLEGTTGVSILVSSKDKQAVGSPIVADRAKYMLGRRRKYNFLLDNCHQFAAGCLTGNFNNTQNFLWMVKDEAERRLSSNTWREWR